MWIVGALLPAELCFDLREFNGTEAGGSNRTALAVKEGDIEVLVVLTIGRFDATEIGARRGSRDGAVVSSWTCFAR